MRETPVFQVDAFTAKPFLGNPAAVCILGERESDSWMQSVAAEMNLAETAFLLQEGDATFALRWFTPTVEVSICGHATLASAHILWETGLVQSDHQVTFYTLGGTLSARKHSDWIELDFPVDSVSEVSAPDKLLQGLGAAPLYVGQTQYDYLVEVASGRVVKDLDPNLSLLKELSLEGVIVTSRSQEPPYDFVSRYFAPKVGIDEDPVSGAAHCGLAQYWSRKLGKDNFLAYQASTRSGILKVSLRGSRVLVSGQAITVFRGHLLA